MGMNRITTHIDINGFEVQLFEKIYDYASLNADFSNYADEEVDMSSFAEDDLEASFPNVLVRKINLYEDVNFLVGTVNDNGLPETILIDDVGSYSV